MDIKDFNWNSLAGRVLSVVFLGLTLLVAFYSFGNQSASSPAREGKLLFEEQCESCHSIGGGIVVGPDLKGVLDRRDRVWITRFIATPDWLIAEGDPLALELLEEFNGIEMPNRALTDEDVENIIIFLEVQDSLTQAAASLPTGYANRGEALFVGTKLFENGGTPCVGCHTVGSVGAYGGGNLGPDLTHAYARYGEPGLASAMQNISFPTMKNVYLGKALSPNEAADLLAFFTEANEIGTEGVADLVTGLFWGAGTVGAFGLFIFMAFSWPRQSKNQTERLRKKADAASRRIS